MGIAAQPSFQTWTESQLAGTEICYDVERHVRLDYGFVEVGRYRWRAPIDRAITQTEQFFALNMALSPRPASGDGAARDEGLGRVMVLAPGATFRLKVRQGEVRSLQCALDRGKLEELAGRPVSLDEVRRMTFDQAGPVIELLLNRIYEELREQRHGCELAIDGYAQILCVELARALRDEAALAEVRMRKGGLPAWRMRLIETRLAADLPAPQIEELAALCGMTVRQLGRAFKQETGRTLGRFIDEAVHERACVLLGQEGPGIGAIAARLGFASSGSFTCAFRRLAGIAPSEFRRRGGRGS